MKGEFLFLGTGGSSGVPMIGCECAVCTSTLSQNNRLRSSGLIQIEGKSFLIDAGPDFRQQALKHKIHHLDAVLFTHAHSDHISGIDDLRAYYILHHKRIPCILSQETYEEIKLRFHYLVQPHVEGKSFPAQLDFQILKGDTGTFVHEGIEIGYFTYFQSEIKVTGFRFGNFAYVSDIKTYSEKIFDSLQGVETLVLSALRHEPSPMHFSIEEAIAFARRVGARMTYLTHLAHDLEHNETNALLPPDVRMGYDGLKIPVTLA